VGIGLGRRPLGDRSCRILRRLLRRAFLCSLVCGTWLWDEMMPSTLNLNVNVVMNVDGVSSYSGLPKDGICFRRDNLSIGLPPSDLGEAQHRADLCQADYSALQVISSPLLCTPDPWNSLYSTIPLATRSVHLHEAERSTTQLKLGLPRWRDVDKAPFERLPPYSLPTFAN
jgi:hypothetical protein